MRNLVLSIIGGILTFQAASQQLTIPSIENYTTKDYNAHAQNFAVRQDEHGIMYVANVNGLLEFDGLNWNLYQPDNNSLVFSVDVAADGNIYMGGLSEFGKLQTQPDGSRKFQSLSQDLPDSIRGEFANVWNTHALEGAVYFNAGKYLFEWINNEIQIHTPPGEIGRAFKVGNELWVSILNKGLFHFQNGGFEILDQGALFADMTVTSIIPIQKDRFVVVTRKNGAYIFSTSDQFLTVPFAEKYSSKLAQANLYGGIRLNNGNLIFNSLLDGFFMFNEKQELVSHISRQDGLQNAMVIGVYEDRVGNLWCALDNGISMVSLTSPLSFSYEGEQFFGAIQEMIKYREHIYLATMEGAFSAPMILDSLKPSFQRIEGIKGTCFEVERIGDDILFGSDVIYSLEMNIATPIAEFPARVISPLKGRPGMFIAGGVKGLIIMKKKDEWVELLEITEIPDEVYYIIETNPLEFWIGTFSQGVIKVSVSDDFERYDISRFSNAANNVPEGQFSMFLSDGKITLSADKKNYQFNPDNSKFELVESVFGIKNHSIFRIKSLKDHQWVLTSRRLFHCQNNSIDSLPFMSISVGGVNALLPEENGSVWIGGDDALMFYDHTMKRENLPDFHCNIRQVSLGDSVFFRGHFDLIKGSGYLQPEDAIPVFTYENNSITFNYAASYFDHADHLEYAYQLEGYKNEYSVWKKESRAVFTNLPEGEYVFRVKARNIYGQESLVSEYRFEILPPWYRTWWAYLLFGAAGVFILVMIVRLYAQRLKKEKVRLESIVRERTIELDEKNKKLELTNAEILQQKVLLEDRNKDITDSIQYAKKIQSAILTSDGLFAESVDDHFILYLPKDILSGDFYWAYRYQDDNGDHLIWSVVDCTGHGVPGAMVSLVGYNGLNKIVREFGITSPETVLDELKKIVEETFTQGADSVNDGMDISVCCLHLDSGKLKYAGANSSMWIHRQNTGLEKVRADRQPVGRFAVDAPFTLKTFTLHKGESVYLMSDGYADQFGGPNGKKFKSKQLANLIESCSDQPMDQQRTVLLNAIEAWKNNTEQIDDITVLGIRF